MYIEVILKLFFNSSKYILEDKIWSFATGLCTPFPIWPPRSLLWVSPSPCNPNLDLAYLEGELETLSQVWAGFSSGEAALSPLN